MTFSVQLDNGRTLVLTAAWHFVGNDKHWCAASSYFAPARRPGCPSPTTASMTTGGPSIARLVKSVVASRILKAPASVPEHLLVNAGHGSVRLDGVGVAVRGEQCLFSRPPPWQPHTEPHSRRVVPLCSRGVIAWCRQYGVTSRRDAGNHKREREYCRDNVGWNRQ